MTPGAALATRAMRWMSLRLGRTLGTIGGAPLALSSHRGAVVLGHMESMGTGVTTPDVTTSAAAEKGLTHLKEKVLPKAISWTCLLYIRQGGVMETLSPFHPSGREGIVHRSGPGSPALGTLDALRRQVRRGC